MADIVAWIALGISFILGIIKVAEALKNWKKPKVEVEIDVFPASKLELKSGIKWIELKNFHIHLINSGNEDVLIRNLTIEHLEYSNNGLSWKYLDKDFNLPARASKDYTTNITISYNPREHKLGGKWDSLKVIAEYNKKKSWEIFYFIIDEKTGNIAVFSTESSLKKL